MLKNAIFLKFQMWVFGQYWPIIGWNIADKVRSTFKSYRNFLYCPNSKIEDFNSKKHTPPQKKGPFGGGVELHVHLIQV